MTSHRSSQFPIFRTLALLAILCVVCVPAWSQVTVVDEDGGTVVTDGQYVRIDSDDEEVDVDWRSGSVHVRDADDDVMIELGAVRGDDHIRVDLGGDVLFDFGSDIITAAAEETLHDVAQVIRRHAVGEVLIAGHTDAIGDALANHDLSERRALAVIRWLHRHEGIPTHVLAARGFGEERPVAPNSIDGRDNPRGRAKNRRVEVIVGTTKNADVRQIADRVVIDGDRVDMGDVVVDGDDVQIRGLGNLVAASTRSASGVGGGGGGNTTCPAGKRCDADCPDGNCRMECAAGAVCDYACRGGNCHMSCASGATCTFSCAGGDCRFEKAFAANCQTSCSGGGCRG